VAATPLNLVNGFLGSGKTTFLLHYLGTFSGERKIAVIQNEFSSSGIDGEILRHNTGAYQLLEINNGSVFCVCLLGSFIDSLASFIEDYSPDEIIMESSGMSDPVSIGQIFQSPKLRGKVYLGYSWTIVDALNFNKVTSIRSRLEHQVRIADTVVVNKCDLAADEAETVLQTVKKINPFASFEKTSYARIDFKDKKNAMKFFPAPERSASSRPDLQSVVIKSSRTITRENLVKFIDSVKDDFIRCKGFVSITGNRKIMVQGSFREYNFSDVDWFSGITELVGIGNFNEKINYSEKFEDFCSL